MIVWCVGCSVGSQIVSHFLTVSTVICAAYFETIEIIYSKSITFLCICIPYPIELDSKLVLNYFKKFQKSKIFTDVHPDKNCYQMDSSYDFVHYYFPISIEYNDATAL